MEEKCCETMAAVSSTALSNTPVQILGPNTRRKAVILSGSTQVAVSVSFDPNFRAGRTSGMITVSNGLPVPLVITREQIGSAIDLPWYACAIPIGQTTSLEVCEILYDIASAS